jgi:hypothetical protein
MTYSTKLERLYEAMLVPIGPMSVSMGPAPETDISHDEEISEEEEVCLAKKIIKLTNELDDIASEAHVKAYGRRIEDVAEEIRQKAKKLVRGHSTI